MSWSSVARQRWRCATTPTGLNAFISGHQIIPALRMKKKTTWIIWITRIRILKWMHSLSLVRQRLRFIRTEVLLVRNRASNSGNWMLCFLSPHVSAIVTPRVGKDQPTCQQAFAHVWRNLCRHSTKPLPAQDSGWNLKPPISASDFSLFRPLARSFGAWTETEITFHTFYFSGA